MKRKLLCVALSCAATTASNLANATNGMNMEGYGPIATAMGGASMAYDNGTAAMMNNPATLALMSEGRRVDLAFGYLGPDVKSSYGNASAKSTADAFYMPAFGWLKKFGKVAYGFGIYGQGGMGTEYEGSSFMGAGKGLTARSELSVGRVLFPLAIEVTPDLQVGGTLDFVWAQLDMQMPMEKTQVDAMGLAGMVGFSGSMAPSLATLNPGDVAYINFSNGNRFTGQAKATGYAGKIGFTYKVNPQLTLGGTYHSSTALSDMETHAASLSMVTAGGTQVFNGKMTVHNFQWPETYGLGVAFQANDRLMLVADVKHIGWANVMKDFKLGFIADNGQDLNITFNQHWKDQNVIMLGGAYRYTKALTLRAGINLANNPVPDYYMNALFPAIIRNHVMLGFGYALDNASSVDFSLTHAPQVTATNALNQTVTHSQTSWQFIYSYRY